MKYEIEIEGLPEGYEIENLRITEKEPWSNLTIAGFLNLKKKQPRRIILEDTGEFREAIEGEWTEDDRGYFSAWPLEEKSSSKYKIWHEVKED